MKPAIALLLAVSTLSLHAGSRKTDPPHTALNQSLDRLHLSDPSAQWSLHAQVQFLDRDTLTSSGTIEFLRVSAGQYRVTYNFPGFHQVLTATPQGQFVQGNIGDPPAGLSELLHFLRTPLDRVGLNVSEIGTFHARAKSSRLECMYTMHDPWPTAKDLTFCTTGGSPALRYVHLPSHYEFFFAQTGTFHGGDVPVAADVLYGGIRFARVQFAFRNLTNAEQASVQIPSGAPRKFDEEADRAVARQLTGSLRHSPSTPHVQDVSLVDHLPLAMVLRIQLGTDGKVAAANVIASRDQPRATAFADSLIGLSLTAPASRSRFVNYNIVIPKPQESAPSFGDPGGVFAAH